MGEKEDYLLLENMINGDINKFPTVGLSIFAKFSMWCTNVRSSSIATWHTLFSFFQIQPKNVF